MAQRDNNALKKIKLKVKKTIYRLRRYALGIGTIGAMATPTAAQAQPNPAKDFSEHQSVVQTSAENASDKDLLAYGRMVEVNVDAEIADRAQWFVDEFVAATSKHLRAIKRAAARGQKSSYVKNNFFDVVYPSGGLSGRNNYCITAINRALIDANEYGDLNNVLPEYKSREGGQAVECRRFVNYLSQKGYGDCIKQGYINTRDLEVGDIVMTPRGGGRYHATTYIGKGKVRSFNNDGEWELKRQSGIVIKTRAMAEKAIKLDLERQKLITPRKAGKQVVPLQKAQKIMKILYNGRNMGNQMAMLLEQSNKNDLLLADNLTSKTIAEFRAKREI